MTSRYGCMALMVLLAMVLLLVFFACRLSSPV
jgi:hypothetical protein